MNGRFLFLTNIFNIKFSTIYLCVYIYIYVFICKGKALLLLNEDSFKQRSLRSGDILYKALQQHKAMLKSWHCQGKLFFLY